MTTKKSKLKTGKHILIAAIALLPSLVHALDLTGGNTITGAFSSANGNLNTIPGSFDWASGYSHIVNGNYNNVFGFTNTTIAGNLGSILINGAGNSIGGYGNTVFGNSHTAANGSLANLITGFQQVANGSLSFIGGRNNSVTGSQSLVFGSFLSDGGLAGSVMLSDSNPHSLRTAGAGLFTNVTPDTFNGTFNRGYFLFTNDGQGANPNAGVFIVPTGAGSQSATVSNPAFVGINVNPPTQALDVVGNGLFSGSIGISTTPNAFPLTIGNDSLGDKISLYGQAGNHFGFGIRPGLLQIHTDLVANDIAFGAGASANFIENVRFKGNGNVGIGTGLLAGKLHVSQQAAAPTLVLQGGEAENVATPTRSGLAFSYYAFDVAKHFITTNHSTSTAANNKMSFWLNTGAGFVATDTPGNGTTRVMTLAGDGKVGIGTNSPGVTLDVVGFTTISNSLSSSYFGATSGLVTGYTGGFGAVTIRADNTIVASLFAAISDERIKNVQGRSDGAEDLRKLSGIEITDYLYKDVVGKGSGKQKKVIAQQVEKVFPQAVSKTIDVVPDIYKKAPITNGWVDLATDLKTGDRVRLITEDGTQAVHEVLDVAQGRFRTDLQTVNKQVFVYGREVKDFRTVDYEAISMLNVSATQQIKKEKDAEVQALRGENAALRAKLDAQEKRLAGLEAKDRAREARLARLEAASSPAPVRAIPAVLELNAAAR